MIYIVISPTYVNRKITYIQDRDIKKDLVTFRSDKLVSVWSKNPFRLFSFEWTSLREKLCSTVGTFTIIWRQDIVKCA